MGIRMNNSTWNRLGMIVCAGLIGGLGGCVSYTNVPVPESAPAFTNANHSQTITVMTRAIEAVIAMHPPRGEYVVNLPTGTSFETCELIAEQLPEGVIVAYEGMDDETEGMLSVYHIGRVWIRAATSKVDVVYPFTGENGVTSDQCVTVWLRGGVRSWREVRMQHWAAGTIPTPPIYVPIPVQEELVEEVVQEVSQEHEEAVGGQEAADEAVVETGNESVEQAEDE